MVKITLFCKIDIMKIVNSEKIPIKIWSNDIEDGAMQQARNLANLPFAFSHIAIMPDCHQGYGMPIGGVLATEDVIIPNAVGVDIGCGMCAVRTNLTEIDKDTLKKIMGGSKKGIIGIRDLVPLGFNKHNTPQPGMPECKNINLPIVSREYRKAELSLGTLGGGNHFIEIQSGSDGSIWIMIHSGSRNLGKQVADYYNKVAKKLNEKIKPEIDKKFDLAFLPVDSDEAQSYLREMNYCVEYAFANRKKMMDHAKQVFMENFPEINFDNFINIAHNYAVKEKHFGKNVFVHRKGATSAHKDETGIIPGSQGTKSYVVKGKGNPESFESCSHGAGRVMSRKKAIKNLDLSYEIKKLDDLGIIHGIRHKKDLDEASSAYKDIEEVMSQQKELVTICTELSPLAVIKG